MWVHWASLSLGNRGYVELFSCICHCLSLNVLKKGNLEDKLPRELGKGWDPDPHRAEGALASHCHATHSLC